MKAFLWLALVLIGLPIDAAPQLICYTVQPHDTAAQLAVRLTNDARNQHASWFQIFDPATGEWIAKTRYARLQPGWRACVLHAKFTPPRHVDRVVDRFLALIVAVGWWWFPLVTSASALVWTLADAHADRQRKVLVDLEHFGKQFVREFERPLIQQSTRESPVQSRVTVIPHLRRLEILLAPCHGHSYPNLSDHRKNLEYDVNRVVSSLAAKEFVLGDLGMQGPWVVIPFRLDASSRKEG